MADKFRNKYRITSARMQQWDYGWNAAYFVSICTLNREHYFGEIVNGKMQLSVIGKIVELEWLKTFEMRNDMNLQQGAFVIMPNHFHAIIVIGKNKYNSDGFGGGDTPKNKFGPQSKNLASIIRGFKIGVTKNARTIIPDFAWQSRFHDHIIRNDKSFERIRNYILSNPENWGKDKFN